MTSMWLRLLALCELETERGKGRATLQSEILSDLPKRQQSASAFQIHQTEGKIWKNFVEWQHSLVTTAEGVVKVYSQREGNLAGPNITWSADKTQAFRVSQQIPPSSWHLVPQVWP